MSLLRKIDTFLLDSCFQPFSDWFNNLTGKNNSWICRCIIRINGVVGLLISFVLLWIAIAVSASVLKILIGTLSLLWAYVSWLFNVTQLKLRRKMEHALLVHEGEMNPLRVLKNARELRLIFGSLELLMLWNYGMHVWELPILLFTICNTCLFFDVYFMACTPNPRKRNPVKVKKAAEVPLGTLPQGA